MRTPRRILIVIPARWGSSRFPGKPLARIDGKTMIAHVAGRARQAAKTLDAARVIVATDDERIAKEARSCGVEVMMTSERHESGTERVGEAAARAGEADLVVNLQGDLPFFSAEALCGTIREADARDDWEMATVRKEIMTAEELFDSNTVKVVCDARGFALYFSRAPIPWRARGGEPIPPKVYYKHFGIYLFRPSFLRKFSGLPAGDLERAERLEQLRALEAGAQILVLDVSEELIEVNTPADIERLGLR